MTGPADLQQSWATVWGEDRVSGHPGGAIAQAFDALWRRELAALSPPRAALELGAGAAAGVARLIAGLWPEAAVTASDYRGIVAEIPGVRWAPDAPIEALPFENGAFDLVVAQFAFEYANFAPAAAELARVLRPGGAARLLMHSAESFYFRYLQHRLACLKLGAQVSDLTLPKGSITGARRIRLQGVLRQIGALLDQYAGEPLFADVTADLQDFRRLAQTRMERGLAALDDADRAFLESAPPGLALAEAQEHASLSRADMADLMHGFRAAGFEETAFDPVISNGLPQAWIVRLSPSARG